MNIDSPNTKDQIFNIALRMFAENGYENVSIRTIADAVGIKASSIYNHYKSKEEILEACYNFYIVHSDTSRLTMAQYDPIILNGTKEEVLNVINYSFTDDIFDNMILSMIIVFSRTYNDDRAKDIYIGNVDSSMQFLLEFFNRGIELGRFHPFNVPDISLIFLSSRLFCANYFTMPSANENKWFQSANNMFDDLLNIIPFKY